MTPDGGAASRKPVEAVRALTATDFNIWQYYESRADQLGQELWSVGSWLAALLGATLSLPFVADFIRPLTVYPYLQLANRTGVGVTGVFGLLLCVYFCVAIERCPRTH